MNRIEELKLRTNAYADLDDLLSPVIDEMAEHESPIIQKYAAQFDQVFVQEYNRLIRELILARITA